MSNTVIIEETLLSGKLEPEAEIEGKIFSEFELKGELALPVGYRDYDGPYNVIPKVVSQELDTADKHLSKDVTVEAIPYYEVSNQTGKTIIIGGN
jgi:hypothetical protein